MDQAALIHFLENGETMLLSPSTASKKRARTKNKYDTSQTDEPECNFMETNEAELEQWYEECWEAREHFRQFYEFYLSYVNGSIPDQ